MKKLFRIAVCHILTITLLSGATMVAGPPLALARPLPIPEPSPAPGPPDAPLGDLPELQPLPTVPDPGTLIVPISCEALCAFIVAVVAGGIIEVVKHVSDDNICQAGAGVYVGGGTAQGGGGGTCEEPAGISFETELRANGVPVDSGGGNCEGERSCSGDLGPVYTVPWECYSVATTASFSGGTPQYDTAVSRCETMRP